MTGLRVLVSGANGFVGRALCAESAARGLTVRAATRKPHPCPAHMESIVVGDIHATTDWRAAVTHQQVVVHAAARVHVMTEPADDPLVEFRRVNVQGTLRLAEQAAAAGVARFVYLSSVKVNGEWTLPGRAFRADDEPSPLDAYGLSKLEAEQGLAVIAQRSGMELVIIRPTLVYGPGVKANFAVMVRWLRRGVPLPLGAIHNQRSLVGIDNLVDLIITCMAHPAAAHQTFMASDGEDVSTTELLRRLGQAMNRPALLMPVPSRWIEWAASLVGKKAVAQRLCGSLQVDMEKTRERLGWRPPVTLDEGLRRTTDGWTGEKAI